MNYEKAKEISSWEQWECDNHDYYKAKGYVEGYEEREKELYTHIREVKQDLSNSVANKIPMGWDLIEMKSQPYINYKTRGVFTAVGAFSGGLRTYGTGETPTEAYNNMIIQIKQRNK